ncbi:MAG: SDR family oxidoreductase [Gemmatimonadales bacterium]|nr:MAG: SDR family oxidoreductase [Gemmatimonadales bacterium]
MPPSESIPPAAAPSPDAPSGAHPSLEGRSFLVVGGTSGIGLALSRRLGARGARVVATGRDRARMDELDPVPGVERRVLADAADFEPMDDLLKELSGADAPRLSGVVNCAGSILLRPAHLTSADDLAETLRQNLVTAFSVVRAAGRHLPEGGSVVLFSTAAVRLGLAAHEAVAAAKGGVEGLTRSAAATYAGRRLRFNAVAPGLVETPMAERIVGNEAGRKASLQLHALGRLGAPEDVAAMVEFLLEPGNDWITGQVFGVDGGLGSVRGRGG